MAVKQAVLWMVNAEEADPPSFAVATDGETAVATYSSRVPEDLASELTENFNVKVGISKELSGWEPIDVLTYNLMFAVGETTEYASFEEAQAAAQEAFGE